MLMHAFFKHIRPLNPLIQSTEIYLGVYMHIYIHALKPIVALNWLY